MTSKKQNEIFYDENFYDAQAQKSFQSALKILRNVFDIYRPKSIVDFGCGQGTWLAAAEKIGISKLKGYDGDWVDMNKLYGKKLDFESIDLEQDINLNKEYDLAMSLEVAEHLNKECADSFVTNLCNASDVVLFSAAIKDQGGTNHINEQWQSYWVELFAQKNYKCFDVLRTKIWNDKDVEWWYRQNIFIFVNEANKQIVEKIKSFSNARLLDVAHPDNYNFRINVINNLNTVINDKEIAISQKEQEIQQKEQEIQQKEQIIQTDNIKIQKIQNSKSFQLGNLFFRSIKKPYKLLTFPINFTKILIK